MISNTILELLHQYGYLIFYFAFSFGPFGIPIPNEITIISGAILSHTGVINAWITYFCILSGLLTAITIAYFAGKFFGPKIKLRLQHNKHFIKAEQILNKRGNWAMSVGLFIPLVRYVLPVVIGLNGKPFKKFALISYSSALLWTTTYFTVGTYFGYPFLTMLHHMKF
ncbi:MULTISPECIES: DedA family protein [Paenibacillus]|uniref:Membrane protein DedA with SNARE-associated domain n=1 Tax=Paenibacillus pabuli TaxID=1472 RepID=A0A855XYK3_9BACL|nr:MULTISPECIES: DedA family protein [Paenibacillus]PWW32696.1 membrane protein DedA with SNARE-associated domain [Paenibacillus pabuli]PXV98355.1 membrane protein DedA with SNARE-associated domain [Paenibacillus taichungensis]